MKPIWFKFLNGPMYISPDRFAQLQADPKPLAVDLMRNYRKLSENATDHAFFASQIKNCRKPEGVLPHIYYLADKIQPFYRQELHEAFVRAKYPEFKGKLCVLIDLSRQMTFKTVAGIEQMELAACLAAAANCKTKRIFTVSNNLVEVHPPLEGLGCIDKILSSQSFGASNIDKAINDIQKKGVFDQVFVYSLRCFTLDKKVIMPNNGTIN
jgi:hypothetical protein